MVEILMMRLNGCRLWKRALETSDSAVGDRAWAGACKDEGDDVKGTSEILGGKGHGIWKSDEHKGQGPSKKKEAESNNALVWTKPIYPTKPLLPTKPRTPSEPRKRLDGVSAPPLRLEIPRISSRGQLPLSTSQNGVIKYRIGFHSRLS